VTKPSNFNPLVPQPLLIVISGLPGVGKDSVVKRMLEREPHFHFVVTVNTRPPRPGEIDGIDYIFVSEERYFNMKKQGELLESARVYNEYKGVPKNQVETALSSGKDVVMRLDVQGARRIRQLCPDALLIFITTQDEDEMVRRLEGRRTESAQNLKQRIATAREELNQLEEFDYLVVNRENQLERAVDDVLGIIAAEHHRVHPRKVTL
jgi:guanylate kinase